MTGYPGPATPLAGLLILLGTAAPTQAADEILAVVYERGEDGGKGRRVHREELLGAATEERSAILELCGRQFFAYAKDLEALQAFDPARHLTIVYETTIDPVTKNSRREEICRSEP